LAVAILQAGIATASCAADPGDGPKSADAASASSANDSLPGQTSPADVFDSGEAVDPTDSAATTPPAEAAAPAQAEASEGGTETPEPEAAAPEPSCTTCPLVVQYMTPTTTATTQEIRPHFEIMNNGTSSQDLSALTLRYWYTADGSTSQAFDCDYALVGCSLVQATFVAMTTPTATADHYMEVSFTGGSVMAASGSGEIQTRFHDTNYAVTFTQTNDYSFNGSDAAYAQWSQVTLYRGGTLVWGVEP
jgi:cellulose binding protein with CBM3 domain